MKSDNAFEFSLFVALNNSVFSFFLSIGFWHNAFLQLKKCIMPQKYYHKNNMFLKIDIWSIM